MRGYEHAAQLLAARRSESPIQVGTVFRKTVGRYWVDVDGQTVVCGISSRLRKVLVYPISDPNSMHPRVQYVDEIKVVDPVAIGDFVGFVDAEDGMGLITEVHERKNALARRAAGKKALEQVVVANVDQVVTVFAAAQPAPKWELLDRYLAATEAAGLPALVCITKCDLVDRTRLDPELDNYRRIGYSVIATSVVTGEGVAEIKRTFAESVSVLTGASGVGKSSLLNAIQPGLALRIASVSDAVQKGRHTTVTAQLVPLDCGGYVADTPGLRELGLWGIEPEQLEWCFPEFRPYLGTCKYGNSCTHVHEPGCAVLAAVGEEISPERYESYRRMMAGDEEN